MSERTAQILAQQWQPSDMWFDPRKAGKGIAAALAYPVTNPGETAEFGLSMAPGSGEAMSARDAWDASGRAAGAIQGGDWGQAASEYGNLATALVGALPGAGIIARGTKRGAAWMDRNLPSWLNKGLDAAMPSDPKNTAAAFPAWHGSPHDFDEFKLDKIGTGEGAQAYGHGLYFAENPAVAKQYRQDLSDEKIFHGADELTEEFANAADLINRWGGNKEAARRALQNLLANPNLGDTTYIKRTMAALDQIDPAKLRVEKTGRLYNVEIDAEPHQLLDWDKPLSEQGEVGEKALSIFGRMGFTSDPTRTLGDIKQIANERYGRGSFKEAEVSNALREAGIPGIRYLDQGSRDVAGGTSNYVIFDDKLTKILSKE